MFTGAQRGTIWSYQPAHEERFQRAHCTERLLQVCFVERSLQSLFGGHVFEFSLHRFFVELYSPLFCFLSIHVHQLGYSGCNKRTSLARASSLMRLRSSSVALLLRFAFFVPVFNLLSCNDVHSSVHRGQFLYRASAPSRDILTVVDESLAHLLRLPAARRLLRQLDVIC